MHAPRVKQVHRPYRTGDKIRIGGAFGVAAEITDADGVVWSLMTAMDGVRAPEEIARVVHGQHPRHSVEDLRDAVAQLVETGFFEDGGAGTDVDPRQRERYSRSVAYYSHVDRVPRRSVWEVHRKIAASHVVVLGVGGVGSACAYSLAASGVGSLTIVDDDLVEPSNLNRQLLYVTTDVGRPKVVAAAERITALRPDIRLDARQAAVDTEAGVQALFGGADLVVLGADEPPELEGWCNRAALRTGTAWVDGSYDGPHICVTLYAPGEGPCWRCMRLAHYDDDDRPRDTTAPRVHMVTAATANLTGNLAAHIALARLTGVAAPTPGEPVLWNTVRLGHAFTVPVPRRPDCPECGTP
jgi:molybdopterin/thiamine biosynthesis adenylyltransferase